MKSTRFAAKLSVFAAFLTFALTATWIGPSQAAPTLLPKGGVTTVQLSQAFVETLGALNIAPDDISPGRLTSRGKAFFYIPGGGLDFGNAPPTGEIIHVGGLSLTDENGNTFGFFNYIIDTVAGQLTGQVTANGDLVGRVPIFDLDFSAAEIKSRGKRVTINNVGITLTDVAADALNGFFYPNRDPVFPADFNVGVAKVFFRLPYHYDRFDDD